MALEKTDFLEGLGCSQQVKIAWIVSFIAELNRAMAVDCRSTVCYKMVVIIFHSSCPTAQF